MGKAAAVVGTAALLLVGPAGAVYGSPSLLVSGAQGTTTLRLSVATADESTAKVAIHGPAGLRAMLGQAAGTVLAPGLRVEDAAQHVGAACPTRRFTSVWSLRAQSGRLPVYVSADPLVLEICFEPGSALTILELSLGAVVARVPPLATWYAVFTPGSGRSVVAESSPPAQAIEIAKAVAGNRESVRGFVPLDQGRPRVTIYAGKTRGSLRRIGTTRAGDRGGFAYTGRDLGNRFFQARVTVPGWRGHCAGPNPFGLPCSSATIAGWSKTSKVVRAQLLEA